MDCDVQTEYEGRENSEMEDLTRCVLMASAYYSPQAFSLAHTKVHEVSLTHTLVILHMEVKAWGLG